MIVFRVARAGLKYLMMCQSCRICVCTSVLRQVVPVSIPAHIPSYKQCKYWKFNTMWPTVAEWLWRGLWGTSDCSIGLCDLINKIYEYYMSIIIYLLKHLTINSKRKRRYVCVQPGWMIVMPWQAVTETQTREDLISQTIQSLSLSLSTLRL